MNADPLKVVGECARGQAVVSLKAGYGQSAAARSTASALPPGFMVDELAREEWERVIVTLSGDGRLQPARRSLLAGYCNAVARAIRAEQTLVSEGRYYETTTRRGSVMRRRHPAAIDAEEGWKAARHFAKQLGIIGESLGEQQTHDLRRSLFK
jgi:P27 family predicted phage terminase small subunit